MFERAAVVGVVLACGCSVAHGDAPRSTSAASVSGDSSCTVITGAGQQITDAQGNAWTLSGGVVLENGSDAGYSANVTQLVYSGGQIYQENSAGGWWVWSGGTWVSTSDPTATCPGAGPSPNCTIVTGAGQSITDSQGNAWTIAGGVVLENGADAGYSANVVELAYAGAEVYQENAAGNWWGWSGGTWVSAADPTVDHCSPYGGGTGRFYVSGGQIIDPRGQPFLARGINVYDSQMSAVSTGPGGAPLTSVLPGINFVRLNVYSNDDPSRYQAFIDQLTPLGIVVELEDHTNDAGNAGGGAGTIYTGQQLNDELSWYASVASTFAGNPYVWFGTDNEPSEDPSAAALSTWQQQTYDAIRNAGNDGIVMIEMNCGTTPSSCGAGYTGSAYAGMTNVVWDMHYYGWIVGYSTDANAIAQSVAGNAQASQAITSADGTMPVVIGEYGVSTDGQSTDANGTQVVAAVQASGYGSIAWGWDPGANDDVTDGSNNLTSYGQQVAQFIAH